MRTPYSSMSRDPAERAKALLCHYINVAAGRDITGDPDCASEIGSIIDDAIEAATERSEKRLNKRINWLESGLRKNGVLIDTAD